MKARIKFQKYGSMKFIGHLDVMRYFQKAFRRAQIDNEYSKGYNPHQIMSFAAPLGVGLTSDGEYLDVQLLSSDAPEVMVERLNAVLTEGCRITDFHPLLDPEENKRVITAMSLVASADYMVSLKDGYLLEGISSQETFENEFKKFLDQNEIVIDKKTKNSEKAVDIRPMITLAVFSEQEYFQKSQQIKAPAQPISIAEKYENGIKIYLQMDTGSAANLKPELIMEAFCEYLGLEFQKFAWQVHRIEVYARDMESNKLISLDQMER